MHIYYLTVVTGGESGHGSSAAAHQAETEASARTVVSPEGWTKEGSSSKFIQVAGRTHSLLLNAFSLYKYNYFLLSTSYMPDTVPLLHLHYLLILKSIHKEEL